MPTIPTIEARTVRADAMNPGIAGSAFGEVEQAGNEMFHLGSKINDAETHLNALKIEGKMKSSISQFEDLISQSTDYSTFDDQTDKFISTARNEFTGMAGENSRLGELVGVAFDTLADDLKRKVTVHKVKLMSDDAKIGLMEETQRTMTEIANNPERLHELMTALNAKGEVLIGDGLIDKVWWFGQQKPIKEQTSELIVRKRLDSAPGTTQQKLEWWSKQDAAKFGITDSSYKQIKGDLKTQWQIEKEQIREREKQVNDSFDTRLAQFYLTYDFSDPAKAIQMEKELLASPIKNKASKATTLRNFIENPEKFQKDDHSTYNTLRDRAQSFDSTLTVEEVDKHIGNGLSVKSAQEIKDIVRKKTVSHEDNLYKDAVSFIQKEIEEIGKESLEDQSEIEKKKYYAVKALDQRLEEGAAKQKTKTQMLDPDIGTNGEITNKEYIVEQIVKNYLPNSGTGEKTQPISSFNQRKLSRQPQEGQLNGAAQKQQGKDKESSGYLPWEHPNWEATKGVAQDFGEALTLTNIQNNLISAGESIGNLTTGIAAFPLHVAGKVIEGPNPEKLDKESWRKVISQSLFNAGKALSYEPKTEQGKQLTDTVNIPFKAIGWVENKMGELARENPKAFNAAKYAVSGMMPTLWPLVSKIDTPEEREWVTKTSFELSMVGLPILSSVLKTKVLPKDIPEIAKNLGDNPQMVDAIKREINDNRAAMKEGVVGEGELLGEKPPAKEIITGEVKSSATAPVEMLLEKEPFLLTAEEKLALQNVRQPVKEIITDLTTLFKDQRGSFSFEKLSPEQKAVHERLMTNLKFVQNQLGKKGGELLDSLGKLNLDEKTMVFARELLNENQKSEQKYAGSINITKQDIPEMAKAIEMQAAESVLPKKRQTWTETDKQSDKLIEDYDKAANALKEIKDIKGLTVNIDAARKINAAAVGRLKEILDEGDSLKFQEEYRQYRDDIFKVVSQGSGEIGRALNAHKKTVGLESMGKAFAKLERELNPRELAELKKLNTDNPLEVKRFIERLGDPKFKDYFYEYWYNSILSGVPTHIVNVASNTGWMAWQVPHRALTAGVDKLISTFTGKQREYFVDEVVPMMAGMKEGFSKGKEGAWEVMKTGDAAEFATKWDREVGENVIGAFERSPHEVLRKIAPYLTVPTRALRAMDVWGNSIAFDAQLRAVKRREGLKQGLSGDALREFEGNAKNTSQAMIDEANSFAKYSTFMDDPGKIVSWLIQGRSKIPGARLVVPFVNTIANLTKRGLEMTPGLGLTLAKGQPWQEVVAKQIEGALIALPVLKKIAAGEITGSAPTDPNKREAFYRQGKIPWGIQFGDTWYSFRRIEPFNTVIASISIAYDAIANAKDDDTATDIFGNIVNGIVDNLLDSSYLSGVTNLLDKYGSRKGWVQRTTASLVPFSGFWRSVNRAYESLTEGEVKVRDTKSFLGAFSQVIPGLSKAMPAKLNIWGEEITLQGGVFRQWLPYKMSEANPDKTEQALETLGVYPGLPSRKVTIDGKKFKLSEELYRDYCVYMGSKMKTALDNLVSKPNFDEILQEKPEKVKDRIEETLKSIRSRTLNEVKRELIKGLK